MNNRFMTSMGTLLTTVLLLLATEPVRVQRPTAAAKREVATKAWTLARTPDGQPDLQGFWTNATFTPLERPDNVTKEFYTAEELAEVRKRIAARGSGEQEPP